MILLSYLKILKGDHYDKTGFRNKAIPELKHCAYGRGFPEKAQEHADKDYRAQIKASKTGNAPDIKNNIGIPVQERKNNLRAERRAMDLFRARAFEENA